MRIAILGTGGMAHTHAQAYQEIEGVSVVAGIEPNAERLAEFQKTFDIPNGFLSLEEALNWGTFDAVSNVTPDAVHIATTLPLLEAGKHVLCEKPLATTEVDAQKMAAAARAAGVVNMVNLSYRDVPALVEAARLVGEGAIGEVRHFEASYLQSWLTQPLWGEWRLEDTWLWRLSTEHGSLGVLGDVGIHILDFATHIAGSDVAKISAKLATFDKAPDGKIGDYVLDANDSATMQVVLNNGAHGVVHTSRFASGHINDLRLRIYGTKGGLDVRSENFESALFGCFEVALESAKWSALPTPKTKTNYERFVDACRKNQPVLPDFDRGAVLQSVLDRAVQSDAQDALMLPI